MWCAHWTEHHTGVLNTKVGEIGVTESEYLCIGFHLTSGFLGQQFWKTTILDYLPSFVPANTIPTFITSLSMSDCFWYGYVGMSLTMFIFMFCTTLWKCKGRRIQALGEYLSISLIILMEYVWMSFDITHDYIGIILTNFGVLTSLLVCKMIVSTVTHVFFFLIQM